MNVNVSECLKSARENHGFSVKDLAEKIGVSEETINDWESDKASPTSDKLILLADLYNMSLDELLQQKKKEEVHIIDSDGSEVIIDNDDITLKDEDGNVVNKANWTSVIFSKINMLESMLMFIAIVTFILLGIFANMWYNAWVFLFVPEIICSAIRAIYKRNANRFSIESLILFVYFFICMVVPGLDAHLWHPFWVLFFLIPLYHIFVSMVIKKN